MNKLTIEDIQPSGRRVLMRVDFNVPLEDGKVANDQRIRAALPTIKHILGLGGRLILMSHLGRPKGQRVSTMSLKACVAVLSELLGTDVGFVNDCIGEHVEGAVDSLGDGEIILLENLRYYKEETENDADFAAKLAKLGDLYVNDAFGTAHRAHASTEGVTHYIDHCAAGYLMMKELDYLGTLMENPQNPFVAILGGAKISGKIDVITNLLPKVDKIIIGGGMVFTFYKAMGFEIGNSLLEEDKIGFAGEILGKGGDKIVLAADCVVSDAFGFESPHRRRSSKRLRRTLSRPDGWGLILAANPLKNFAIY